VAADPADLTTLAAVKAYLKTVSTSDEDSVQAAITAASRFIVEIVDRPIKAATSTRTVSGTGGTMVYLPNTPVISVTSVTVDGAAIPAATPGGSDLGWVLDRQLVVLRGYTFTKGTQNVRVVYESGYTAVPQHIEHVTKKLVGLWYKERDRLGQASKSQEGVSITYSVEALPEDVKLLLEHIKGVVPA
jgi:hypothetical protein